MKLDRNLILLAVFFLFLQLVWLAHELQFIQIPFLSVGEQNQNTWVVGKIVRVHNNVRRRPSSEIIWNEGKETEEVKAYDALLTLKNSAMRVQLLNGAELNLSENTLVYLEPLNEGSKDQRIRIRFSHGSLRSKLNLSPNDFQSESWVISPQAGSEFQLKSFENGQVEIELNKGKVVAEHDGQTYSVEQGEVAMLDSAKKFEKKNILSTLYWKTGKEGYERIYSHHFPKQVQLFWNGDAERLIIYQNGKETSSHKLISQQKSEAIQFFPGSYEIRVENTMGRSNWLRLDVWSAPVIHLMSPLPRDRYQLGETLNYIWLNPQNIRTYTWQMINRNQSLVDQKVEADSRVTFASEISGDFQWRVLGRDSDGYEIPEPYSYPIYFTEKPLDAPDLNSPYLNNPETEPPELRKPASEFDRRTKENQQRKKSKKKNGAGVFEKPILFFAGLVLFSEHAQAEELEKTKTQEKIKLKLIKNKNEVENNSTTMNADSDEADPVLQQALSGEKYQYFDSSKQNLVFSWGKVLGAEFYVLEISETPDFRNPLHEKKVFGLHYEWDLKNLKKQNFYWRVASGSQRQMGRFSKLQEIDLRKLNEGLRYAGVTVINHEKSTEFVENVLADEIQYSENKNSDKKINEDEIIHESERLVSLSLNFEGSSFTDSTGTGFRYSGPTVKFRYSLDANMEGSFRAGGAIVAQSNTWKNIDQDSIMQNRNYYESKSRFLGWFGKKKSPWTLSLGFGYEDVPARAGLETTRFDSSILFNLGAWYDFVGKYYFRGKMGLILNSGTSLSDVTVSYYGYRLFKKYKEINYYWGPDVELSNIRSNSGTTGYKYQLGLLFGIVW